MSLSALLAIHASIWLAAGCIATKPEDARATGAVGIVLAVLTPVCYIMEWFAS